MKGVSSYLKILPIKINTAYHKIDGQMPSAIHYAIDRGVDIINISLKTGFHKLISDAIERAKKKNILIIAASGNKSQNSADYIALYKTWFSNVVSVASSDRDRLKSYFSNYGSESVDIFAPGSDICSTIMKNKYGIKSGTSMATPVVSGVAALVLATHGKQAAKTMRERLVGTAHRFEALSGLVSSNGLIDAHNALTGQLSLNFLWE